MESFSPTFLELFQTLSQEKSATYNFVLLFFLKSQYIPERFSKHGQPLMLTPIKWLSIDCTPAVTGIVRPASLENELNQYSRVIHISIY
jgi:hypothetical protein